MNTIFQVDYIVKTTANKRGEFYPIQESRTCSLNTITNDLNEIFTDLLDIHRYEGLIGIEITNVEELPLLEESVKEIYGILSL